MLGVMGPGGGIVPQWLFVVFYVDLCIDIGKLDTLVVMVKMALMAMEQKQVVRVVIGFVAIDVMHFLAFG